MKPSFQDINYSLRPAKHIERWMLCDIFRKAANFGRLSEYTYLGFGGIEFSDFILFHRSLGIVRMVSIERAIQTLKRVESNKPYNTIEIVGKSASAALPKQRWQTPHLVWLDNDDPLKTEVVLDAGIVSNHAMSGSMLAVSFQCQRAPELEKNEEDNRSPMAKFTSTFGRERVPADTDETDLIGWKYGSLGRKMILSEIETVLAARNLTLEPEKRISYKEVCSIKYSDNAKMFTLAGVFVSHEDESKFDQCEFELLDFISKFGREIHIEVPKLTLREIRNLEQQLPLHTGTKIENGAVPAKDVSHFEKLYRYLPNFAVLEY